MKMVREIFKIDAPWAEKLRKMRVSFLMNPTVRLLTTQPTTGLSEYEEATPGANCPTLLNLNSTHM